MGRWIFDREFKSILFSKAQDRTSFLRFSPRFLCVENPVKTINFLAMKCMKDYLGSFIDHIFSGERIFKTQRVAPFFRLLTATHCGKTYFLVGNSMSNVLQKIQKLSFAAVCLATQNVRENEWKCLKTWQPLLMCLFTKNQFFPRVLWWKWERKNFPLNFYDWFKRSIQLVILWPQSWFILKKSPYLYCSLA